MSDLTKAKLDAALAEHVEDETKGGVVSGYFCQAQYTSLELLDEGMTGYLRLTPEGQNLTTTLGLAFYAHKQMSNYITESTIDPND